MPVGGPRRLKRGIVALHELSLPILTYPHCISKLSTPIGLDGMRKVLSILGFRQYVSVTILAGILFGWGYFLGYARKE